MLAVVIFVVGLAVAMVGVAAMVVGLGAASERLVARGRPAIGARAHGYGRLLAYLILLTTGVGAVLVIGMIGGHLARAFDHNDHRVYAFWLHHQTHALTRPMMKLTEMGNRKQTYWVSAIGAVVLGILAPRRRWVPALALLSIVGIEYYLQHVLALYIHRGHPPVGLGTYPSGGVARLIGDYGLILLLAMRLRGRPSRWVSAVTWALLAGLAWIEFYSRIYLGKHWISDAVGGIVIGLPLLVAVGLAMNAFTAPTPQPAVDSAAT